MPPSSYSCRLNCFVKGFRQSRQWKRYDGIVRLSQQLNCRPGNFRIQRSALVTQITSSYTLEGTAGPASAGGDSGLVERTVLRRLVRGLARKQKGRRQEFHSCGGLLSVFFSLHGENYGAHFIFGLAIRVPMARKCPTFSCSAKCELSNAGRGFCRAGARVFREMWVSSSAW